MDFLPLPNTDDRRLDPYRDLPHTNLTPLSGRFIVEGKWMVERLAASQYAVESVVVDERQLALVPTGLPPGVPVYVLPSGQIESLIGFNFHRGILACGRRRPPLAAADLVSTPGPLLLVACLDIHDPTNLGSILRNCAAFGCDGVLVTKRCADPFSRRVLRVSMGTAFQLRIATFADPEQDLTFLREHGKCELLATVLADDAEPLPTVRRAPRSVLLIGNEGHGLSPACIAACQRRITLPMRLSTDSLNAASASAVFLYELTHGAQRGER